MEERINRKPMISVIMPVHNGEKYLEESIKSILAQSFTDFELIIINDKCTDSSPEIMEKYKKIDKRIRIVKTERKENDFSGIVGALNLGLENAQGKYIARIDDDDLALPERFEKQMKFLETNSDIFLVGTGGILIDETGEEVKVTKNITGHENVLKAVEEKRNPIMHPSIMFRNGSHYKYRVKAKHCEDVDLYLQIAFDGRKLDNIDEPLIKYRLRRNSLSFGNYYKQKMFLDEIVKIYFKKKETGIDEYDLFDDKKMNEEGDRLFTEDKKDYGLIRYFLVVNKFSEMRKYSWEYLLKHGFSKKVLIILFMSLLPKRVIMKIKESRNV